MEDEAPLAMELLAPAGGMEQLRAAVRFGADAVYLAADRFGMRARAANFALADIPAAVAVAHEHGAKAYVACNILMHGEDLDALPPYLRALDAAGVDGLIVSDLGALALVREVAPRIPLHVSTQASVANAAAARVWHDLGARRVVCAREMSLANIARLRADAPPDLEIEAFVHGAMCMAVSGRCLISSYLTGRSGSKGHCTQPCRWSYTLEEEKRPGVHFPVEEDDRGSFIMNAQDLCMLEHLRELAAAGVGSVKIEGRNKKAFYVASVVGAYRRVLDGEAPSAVLPELYAVSHRPYGTGFYFGEAAQAADYDGYEQECLHVADVLGCEEGTPSPSAPSRFPTYIYARCRNRFSEGEELELLAPGGPAQRLCVRNLCWLPEAAPDGLLPEGFGAWDALAAEPVAVANRTEAVYRFELPGPLPAATAGTFLRARRFRRSSRSGVPA